MTRDEARTAGFLWAVQYKDILPEGLNDQERKWFREGMADGRRYLRLYSEPLRAREHTIKTLMAQVTGVQRAEPPVLEALHVAPYAWDMIRGAILARFPGLDIVRLPDSEEGIRSWGISPRDMPTS